MLWGHHSKVTRERLQVIIKGRDYKVSSKIMNKMLWILLYFLVCVLPYHIHPQRKKMAPFPLWRTDAVCLRLLHQRDRQSDVCTILSLTLVLWIALCLYFLLYCPMGFWALEGQWNVSAPSTPPGGAWSIVSKTCMFSKMFYLTNSKWILIQGS